MSVSRQALALGVVALMAVPLTGCGGVPPTHGNVSYDTPPYVEVPDPTGNPPPPKDPHVLDIYMPANPATPPPVLIAVNGGGWLGTNEDDLNVFGGAKMLTDIGFAVVSIRYTVAAGYNADHTFNTSWDWKTLPQDVDKAIRWVRAYAGTLGVDPNRVIVAGHSAGAHLVALVTAGNFAAPNLPAALQAVSSKPNGVILLSGPFDLTAASFPKVPDVLHPGQLADPQPVENLLGCDHRATPIDNTCKDRVQQASLYFPGALPSGPLQTLYDAALQQFPRSFIAWSSQDSIVPPGNQSVKFGFLLCGGYHRQVSWEEVPGDDHGLSGLDRNELIQFLSNWKPDIAPNPPAPPEGSCN